MKQPWAPKTAEERKARVLEEIGEVLIEWGKCGRFGPETRYDPATQRPTTDPLVESNREALVRELEDLSGAIEVYLRDLRQ